MYGTLIVWCVFIFFDIVKLQLSWVVIDFVSISMNLSNIYGYTQCSKKAREKMEQMFSNSSSQLTSAVLDNSTFKGWVMEGLKTSFMPSSNEQQTNPSDQQPSSSSNQNPSSQQPPQGNVERFSV